MRWHQVHRKLLVVLFSIFLLLTVGSTFVSAACHVVTPTGAGSRDGSTWDNAFAGLPATLVRGDTYYIAAGTYPGYRFNTPESGTTVITIKKATVTDHCTETGWQATFGTGQAVWTPSGGRIWEFSNNGYWTVDGQSRTDGKSGHGFKLDNSSNTITYAVNIVGASSTHVTNITIRYTEIAGGGVGGNTGDTFTIASAVRNAAGDTATITTTTNHRYLAQAPGVVGSQIAVSGVGDASFNTSNARVTTASATTVSYANTGTANATSGAGTVTGALGSISEYDFRYTGCVDHVTFEFGYIHDSSDTPFQGDGSFGLGCVPSNVTLQSSVVARNTSNSLHHSEGWAENDANCDSSCTSTSNSIDPNGLHIARYNIFEDIEGTGFIICIGQCRNFRIYGNVFMWHQGNPYRRSGVGNGIVATTSSAKNVTGWAVHNNTFLNTGDTQGGSAGSIVSTANCGTGCTGFTAYNNLCYFPTGKNCGYSMMSSELVHDWTFCVTTGTCSSETHIQTGSSNPFVDWVNENYHLLAATQAGNTLSAPYNTDMDGNTRGATGVWARGALEFVSGAPTISSVTLSPAIVVGGNSSTGTVTISSAAASGGSVVTLSSNNPLIAAGPATVTVPQGGTTATFTVATTAVSSTTLVTITAMLGGSATAISTVNPSGLKPVMNGTVVVNGKVVIQ